MSFGAMSPFAGIQNSSISASGPKLPNGFVGIVEVVRLTMKNGHHGLTFIAETVIHETNMAADAPVGYRPSWTANMKYPNAQGNIMCLLASAFGIDPKTQEAVMREKITQQVAEYAVSEHQPVCGKFVGVATQDIKTQGGNDFTLHSWMPTQKTFASRVSDAPVGAANAPTPMAPSSLPSMPGGFALPQGMAPQQAPQQGYVLPAVSGMQASGGFAPPPIPGMQAPQAPGGFAPPPITGMQVPQAPQQQFAPPQIPQLPQVAQAPQGFAMPAGIPPLPMGQQMQQQAAPFPPAGWTQHPQSADWFYMTSNPAVQKTRADLQAGR